LFLSLLQGEVAGGDSKGFLAEAILEAPALTGRRQRRGAQGSGARHAQFCRQKHRGDGYCRIKIAII